MNTAFELSSVGKGSIVKRPIPLAPPKGAVVKVESSGVCHTDAHLYTSEDIELPRILGHEIAGTIYSLGDEEEQGSDCFRIGDPVVLYPWGGCRNCWSCLVHGSPLCDNKIGYVVHEYGIRQDGGFQCYVSVLSRWSLVHKPEGIPMDIACLTPCSGTTAYHAVQAIQSAMEFAIKGKGVAEVVFVGAGGLSLWATEIIKAIYGNKVKLLVADVEEEKLKDSKKQGADLTLCWTKEGKKTRQLIQAMSGKADAAIDFVNMPSTVESVYPALKLNATYALVGMFGGEMPPLSLVLMAVSNIRWQGINTGNKKHLAELFALMNDKKLHGPPTTNIRLEDVRDTLNGMNAGKVIKGRTVINFVHPSTL